MAPEGSGELEEILNPQRSGKEQTSLKRQGKAIISYSSAGMLHQFYYKNGKNCHRAFLMKGCIVICIERHAEERAHPPRTWKRSRDSVVYLSPVTSWSASYRNIVGNRICSIARYSNIPLLFHKSKPIPGERFRDSTRTLAS